MRPRVVVIGAGFGGLACARGLRGSDVDVVLIDRHNFHTFQPLLYQVATAGLSPADVGHPVRGIFQRQDNCSFRLGQVTGVDWGARHVLLADGAEVPFEYLVVAAGAVTNDFGVEGVAEHALPLYGMDDAIRIRNHILRRFEEADVRPHDELDAGALTFVVVGGGPTGVEVAGALVELVRQPLAKDFHHLDVSRARIVLVEMLDHLLPPFAASSRRHARDALIERGVELRLGQSVKQVTPACVVLDSGEQIPTRTVIWAAGVQASPLAAQLGLETGKGGRAVVGPDLAVPDRPGVFAIGDIAAATDRRGDPLPQLAPVAMQAGEHVARQITRLEAGQPTRRFRYRERGTMATIGRRAAVAELRGGIKLRGSLAWVAWLVLHLVMLIGFRNRLSVLVNWAWNYLTWDRGPRLIIGERSRG